MTPCAFCDEPAERVCSWPVKRDWYGRPVELCRKPVCFRHLVEPGERVYCQDHWHFAETLPRVDDWYARMADENPDAVKPKRTRADYRKTPLHGETWVG